MSLVLSHFLLVEFLQEVQTKNYSQIEAKTASLLFGLMPNTTILDFKKRVSLCCKDLIFTFSLT